MKVSVITSIYNCQDYIMDMVESITAQTLEDWEMIIVDDASTDGTWEILQSIKDDRIIKKRSKTNCGLTKNLNKALELSHGKYIIRMDGDDIAYPSRFEKQVCFMEEHPEVVLSGCWMKAFGKKDDVFQSVLEPDILKINLFFNAVMYHPTFILRKEIIDKYNLRYDDRLLYAQDYNLEFQISKYGKIANIPDILMKYRMHSGQISHEKRSEQLECANITRKEILKELDIVLEDMTFVFWQRFCLLDYHKLADEEKVELKKICSEIIAKNEAKGTYDKKKLNMILEQRLNNYTEKCAALSESNIARENVSDKYFGLYIMMCQWLKLRQEGKRVSTFFTEKNISEIAVYGIGYVGKILLQELSEEGIDVKYCIDKNWEASYYTNATKVYNTLEGMEDVDAIVVTPITYYEEIRSVLSEYVNCPIFSLEDVIFGL